MADNTNRLAGIATVTVDGVAYSISGEGTYRPSVSKRETLTGQDQVHGFSEVPQPGKISWKGRDNGGLSIAGLNQANNVTVVLSLANGKSVIGRNMWRVGDPIEVNTEDATFTVEFEGPDVSEG